MRGARVAPSVPVWDEGIIPAYAGSTDRCRQSAYERRDHPRVCGEHPISASELTRRKGSSPRMRGALPRYQARFLRQGIIPAYAGSTGFRHCKGHARRDHPRVCGEHRDWIAQLNGVTGSSPRMRGARNAGRMLAERNGTDCERFAIVNARSGDIVADTFGYEPTPHGARLKPTESKKASECEDGVVTVHNHPASVYPSYADVKMTVANRNVRGSIVACHDGDVYLIEADKNWADMEKRYWEIYTEKRKELVDRTRTENAAFGQLEAENEVRKWFKITRL